MLCRRGDAGLFGQRARFRKSGLGARIDTPDLLLPAEPVPAATSGLNVKGVGFPLECGSGRGLDIQSITGWGGEEETYIDDVDVDVVVRAGAVDDEPKT